jgi:two-component system, chemotaxis family, protein-glutamate methylesterase/glutaminase
MLVDDSAAIRAAERRLLEAEKGITIVASVGNGQMALDALKRNSVEVVVLDIEMPVMDGLSALPKLLEADPDLKIIMASTLTLAGAEISMQALNLGAADYLPKPSNVSALGGASDFKRGLVEKILALGQARRRRKRLPGARPGVAKPAPAPLSVRAPGIKVAEVLVVGSSTGGPQALLKLFGDLKTSVKLPILITQHMPATFTAILAQHLNKQSGMPAAEGKDGDVVKPGHIYVAPGNYHMLIEKLGKDKVIRLKQTPPENFCRPAVDPMLRSLTEAYDGKLLVVILTGMGQDGMLGAKVAVDAGATVIAQDEASSVVWGMPGAVATAGLASAILPLDRIARQVLDSIAGTRR